VQRPGVDEVVERDAAALRLVASRLEKRSEAANALGLSALAEELISGVKEELDYRHEASVCTTLRENRKADTGIEVPMVYPTLSTDRVLVMEQVMGRSVGDQQALEESPVPRKDLARRVLTSFLGQILDDGMYHADPHPGNLLIDSDGEIWLIDLGSVGRLDSKALESLRDIAIGVTTNDTYVIARATRDMAGGDTLIDIRALEADLSIQLADLGGIEGIDPAMITGVLEVMQRFGLRPPPSMTLLGRALVTLEGTLGILQPGFNFAQSSQEIVKEEHRDTPGDPPQRGVASGPVAAHPPRTCGDDRQPTPRRAPDDSHRALCGRGPGRRRKLGRSGRGERGRWSHGRVLGLVAPRCRGDRQLRRSEGALDRRVHSGRVRNDSLDALGGSGAPAAIRSDRLVHPRLSSRPRVDPRHARSDAHDDVQNSQAEAACAEEVVGFVGERGERRVRAQKPHHEADRQPGLGPLTKTFYYGLGVAVASGWIYADPHLPGYNGFMAYFPPKKLTLIIESTPALGNKDLSNDSQAIFVHAARILTPESAPDLVQRK
jgi:hypothetical protein